MSPKQKISKEEEILPLGLRVEFEEYSFNDHENTLNYFLQNMPLATPLPPTLSRKQSSRRP
jgi:hypothetical protein